MIVKSPATFAALTLLLAPCAWAGTPVKKEAQPAAKAVLAEPDGKSAPAPEIKREWFPNDPAGNFTLGTMFSDHAAGVYLDGITGIWSPQARDAFLFLDSRYHYEDNGQFIASTGLGFRKLVTGHDIIVGANVFWDALHTQEGNNVNQLGLGVEVLTRWVDARFNYYLPEDDRFEIDHHSSHHSHSDFAAGGVVKTTGRVDFTRFEEGLEGYNAEIGVLIPGLDRFAEVRAYAGFYHYENPFGSDYDGFKARLEARLLRGVTANVEYWDDKVLNGGHWTAEIGVTVPFSIYNLFTGKNPFEGAGDAFKRLPRPFSDRMSDMIERSHRIQTVTSDDIETGRSHSRDFSPFGPGGGGGSSGGGGGGGNGFPIE